MFTRFLVTRRPRGTPIAGTVASLTAHAVLVATAIGGDLAAPAAADSSRVGARAAPVVEERLQWIGPTDGRGTAVGGAAGALPPVAYVVPGRGAVRELTPGSAAPPRRAHRTATVPAAALRRSSPRSTRAVDLQVPGLPPELDAALLVGGVVSAAPDFARVASRPDDFVRVRPAEARDPFATAALHAPEVLWTAGRIGDPPIALVTNPMPPYPAELARARVGGRVVVEFLVDSAGWVQPASLVVVQSTNALFTQAVRGVLPRLRFLPAQLGRQSVGVTVRQPFLFVVRPGL